METKCPGHHKVPGLSLGCLPGEAPSCSMFRLLSHDQEGFSREGGKGNSLKPINGRQPDPEVRASRPAETQLPQPANLPIEIRNSSPFPCLHHRAPPQKPRKLTAYALRPLSRPRITLDTNPVQRALSHEKIIRSTPQSAQSAADILESKPSGILA